ncbi:hypothetical protein Tco_0893445 [Tanacetum coccineum]|uniref:Uncharacterized protein n=1 Tax=Tanacetum coccineum TaxID=301880 RepID=A0ABQ5CBQ3_9ASTR
MQVTAQAKEIKALKAQVKKLNKGVKPLLTHQKSWMKSVALKTRLARKTSLKKKGVQKGYVSKQQRKSIKSFKSEPSVHKDPAFDDLDDIVDDAMDYMKSEDAQDEGRTSSCPNKRNEGTDKQDGGTDKYKLSTDREDEGLFFQEEEREMYTIEQRTKFLHDTIAAQRRFLAQQRSEAIRNKPPSRNQLRNQMMTYLKHVGGKKHSGLKTKSFDEIQEMNKQAADASKKRVKKDDSVKGEIKEEEGTRKRKLGKRKKMKSKKRKFTSKDDEELRLCLTIASDEDKEVDYEILDKKYPIIEWRSEYLTTKPYAVTINRENEEDSTMALELIRFVKKQIAELEPKDSDGDEEDP